MEGPSLVILKEELQPFLKQKVLKVSGNTKQPKVILKGMTLVKIDTWAKNIFLIFGGSKKKSVFIKIHFMMFGSYRINEFREGRTPRLELKFQNGIVYFYACSIRFDSKSDFKKVDRQVDLMSDQWNEKHVVDLMAKRTTLPLCDLLLDQKVFAGSGNIVKNEVLFNFRRHPLTKLSQIQRRDWQKLSQAVRKYCFNFYQWKKRYELMRHWQVYRQFVCPICGLKLIRKNLGKFDRRSFFCPHCQKLTKSKTLKVFDVLPPRLSKTSKTKERLDH